MTSRWLPGPSSAENEEAPCSSEPPLRRAVVSVTGWPESWHLPIHLDRSFSSSVCAVEAVLVPASFGAADGPPSENGETPSPRWFGSTFGFGTAVWAPNMRARLRPSTKPFGY